MLKNITLSSNEKLTLISNLHTMLSAGIPILEAVDSLLIDSKNNQKKILQTLRTDLIQGKHLHVALAKFPLTFDKITVNIIKSSEETGTLETTLKDLQNNIKKEIEFNDKIRSALIYPVFILVVFIAVLILILIFVIPKISTFFARMQFKVPLPTKILISTSSIILKHPAIVITSTVTILLILFLVHKKNKKLFTAVFSSLPLISDIIKEIDLTRFSRNFSLLLAAGIPITSALELSREMVIKKNIAKIIDYSKEMVSSGKKLSEGLTDRKKSMPQIMLKIIEAGEKTGSLEKSMQEISEYFDYQVGKKLQTTTALIEPLMIVFIGILIGGMMFSIIGPIYSLIGEIGAR